MPGITAFPDYDYTRYTNDDGQPLDYFDITKYIVTATEWKGLPAAGSISEYLSKVMKDNTLYWEENASKIAFLGDVYKIPDSLSSVWPSPDITPAFLRVLRSALYEVSDKYFVRYNDTDGTEIKVSMRNTIEDVDFLTTDVRKWQFRIEYIPMSSKMKIRARKNAPTKVEYIQPFNQRAEINAASAFGKNMWLTAQKTGVREIKFIKNYPNIKKIPPLGALIRCGGKKYRLVAKHHGMTNHQYIRVTHTLSENWSEKSKHVAVDQKYRNWSIPQDTLWRNLYWEDYLRVGTSLKTSDNVTSGASLADIMKGLCVASTDDKTVDTFAWYSSDDLGKIGEAKIVGATVPCSTYGIANSLIFTATFQDNLSAGLRANEWGKVEEISQEVSYTCEEALYCKADGTLSTARVVLSEGCGTSASVELDENIDTLPEAIAAELDEKRHEFYPSVIETSYTDSAGAEYTFTLNAPLNPVFDKEFYIYKDPGEALKFTYQIHLIGEDDCFFGNKFAEHNPLIKGWKGADRKFKVWALKHYAREGSDILETISGDTAYVHTSDGACFTIAELEQNAFEIKKYGEVFTLTLSEALANTLAGGGYLSWAITDENNNLYVACNDVSVKTLYFQLHHKR